MLNRANKESEPRSRSADQTSLGLQIMSRYLRWILLLAGASVFLVGYLFILQDQLARVQIAATKSLPDKIKVRDDLKAIKTELDAAILDYEKIKESRKEALDRIDILLPEDSQYGGLFAIVDDLARANGFKLLNITISLPDESKPSRQPQRQAVGVAEEAPIEELVNVITIRMTVQGGTYESFKAYLANLERHIRLFDLKSISLNGSSFIPAPDGALPVPQYDLEFSTYYKS